MFPEGVQNLPSVSFNNFIQLSMSSMIPRLFSIYAGRVTPNDDSIIRVFIFLGGGVVVERRQEAIVSERVPLSDPEWKKMNRGGLGLWGVNFDLDRKGQRGTLSLWTRLDI